MKFCSILITKAQGKCVWQLQMSYSPAREEQAALPHIPQVDLRGHFEAGKESRKKERRGGERKGK